MKKNLLLEIAVFSLEAAIAAAKAGAHRIELCDNAADGGTTPSYGMLVEVRKRLSIPVFPIIRPRGGHFVYSKSEFESIKEDVLLCKRLGFEGIVVGFLDAQGHVDTKQLKAVMKIAKPMQVTFHRAFDRTKKPLKALEEIIACGCTRILSSGQFPTAADGANNLRILIEKASDRIIIMPGSGVNSSNISDLVNLTGAAEFHTAARKALHDKSIYSPKTMQEKLSYTSVDKKEIKKILLTLNQM